METIILIIFSILVLLAFATSGQHTQQHFICKSVENVFADTQNAPTVSQSRRIQGSPGKPGPAGSKGDQGQPGIHGRPGTPESVDYETISEMIDQKYSQDLQDIYSRLEEIQRNMTHIHSEAMPLVLRIVKQIRCDQLSGVVNEEKCYFAPYISSLAKLNYDQAVQKCTNEEATIAEIHSRNQQQALENFFRSQISSSAISVDLWFGTSYQMSENNLRFKSGKTVSIDQFYWYYGFPSSSRSRVKIILRIRKDNNDSDEGLINVNASQKQNGVVCEI